MVVVSDRIDWKTSDETGTRRQRDPWRGVKHDVPPWCGIHHHPPEVSGGYLERFPLACIASGIVQQAEIWHHQVGGARAAFVEAGTGLGYRAFCLDHPVAPFNNFDMVDFVRTFGAPHILIIYGLGVSAELLDACARSIIIYNSIDAETLRVPAGVSAKFDLILTGGQWQSDEVAAIHPAIPTIIMPVGPEFAAIDQFRPLNLPKDYDVIYVAAAQAYKQHDILFDAFERIPREMRGLCLFGYGEDAGALRARIAGRGLPIDCIGPPGVPFAEVNRLMNRARIGVVCGREDGAPAILTEYMLAGLPVLANENLVCGTQYILPETGMLAAPEAFADQLIMIVQQLARFFPREAVLARWTWPHTIARLLPLLENIRVMKKVLESG